MSELWHGLVSILLWLVPPAPGASPGREYFWRWKIFVLSSGAALAVLLHIAFEIGLDPRVFAGYATSKELGAVNVKLDAMRAVNARADIIRYRTEECRALTDEIRNFAIIARDNALADYADATKKDYPLPLCADLGKGN